MCEYLTCKQMRGIETIRGDFAQIDGLLVRSTVKLCWDHRRLVVADFASYRITPSITSEGWVYAGDFNQMIYQQPKPN